MSFYRFLMATFTSLVILVSSPSVQSSESGLPSISDNSFSVTPQQEYILGRTWVRMLKGSGTLYNDPVVIAYLEDLLWSIVENSQLSDRRLELVVLDNQTLNAFAVPGGIVGIHTGLIDAAKSEDELASVIAHELAHLSQRHYAARIDEQKRNQPVMMAALLGSLLIAAADAEGGTAALTSTLAASQQFSLAFSRRNEREADYIGMQTLTESGYAPDAMPKMFSRLQANARYGQKTPEFLLTHPVTESRIADSLNRAASLPKPAKRPNAIDYALVRARITAQYSKEPSKLLNSLNQQRNKQDSNDLRYAAVITAIKAKRFDQAHQALRLMDSAFHQKLPVKLLTAELAMAENKPNQAADKLNRILQLFPDNFPANALYAKLLLKQGQAKRAVAIYRKLSEQRPVDVNIWYNLAEAQGLAGNTLEVHIARIKYFMLTGNIDLALRQVKFALHTPRLTAYGRSRLETLEQEAKVIHKQIKTVL
ncbi:MAG: M48 family metalloprotease [Pontibacterium sp.]